LRRNPKGVSLWHAGRPSGMPTYRCLASCFRLGFALLCTGIPFLESPRRMFGSTQLCARIIDGQISRFITSLLSGSDHSLLPLQAQSPESTACRCSSVCQINHRSSGWNNFTIMVQDRSQTCVTRRKCWIVRLNRSYVADSTEFIRPPRGF